MSFNKAIAATGCVLVAGAAGWMLWQANDVPVVKESADWRISNYSNAEKPAAAGQAETAKAGDLNRPLHENCRQRLIKQPLRGCLRKQPGKKRRVWWCRLKTFPNSILFVVRLVTEGMVWGLSVCRLPEKITLITLTS